ncbi:MAG TPA: hypothetical protein VG817_11825 [Gemmatimonadales bacterium]|nr:hypothetical protein [Gemmatimonadales bacterium]
MIRLLLLLLVSPVPLVAQGTSCTYGGVRRARDVDTTRAIPGKTITRFPFRTFLLVEVLCPPGQSPDAPAIRRILDSLEGARTDLASSERILLARIDGLAESSPAYRQAIDSIRRADSLARTPPPPGPTGPVTSPAAPGENSMFFNSREPGCGSDPAIVFCDDFEDGDWYTLNADRARASGEAGWLKQDGWHGTIYGEPITPAGAAACGNRGAAGTDCAATYGFLDGRSNQRNMADHAFAGGPLEEVWARWYYKADPGYLWGAEKHTNFTKAAGDIAFFNIQFNCGTGRSQTSGVPYIQIIHGPSSTCQAPNMSPGFALESGRWYYFEVHARLNSGGNTANGLIEMWVNDCGPTGSCSGVPALRTRLQGVAFDRYQPRCQTAPCKIEVLWFENWANPVSRGTAWLDQIKVSKSGMVGFAK